METKLARGATVQVEIYQLFSKRLNIDWPQFESTCRRQNFNVLQMIGIVFEGLDDCVKKRKCWLPAFSPFSMFQQLVSKLL